MFYSFFFSKGFSLSEWYKNNSLPANSVLSEADANRLLYDELGIFSYMLADQCDFTSSVYSPHDSNGWRKGKLLLFNVCPFDYTVVAVSGKVDRS